MVNFGDKAKIKKAGNLNSGRSYLITTVRNLIFFKIYPNKTCLPILNLRDVLQFKGVFLCSIDRG